MIINTRRLELFEKKFLKTHRPTRKQAFQVMEELYRQAKTLGRNRVMSSLEGVEVRIRIAKVVNCVPKAA